MVYSNQNASFLRDKYHFFSQVSVQSNLYSQFETVDERMKSIDYAFLLKNKDALETEFAQLYTLLQKEDKKDKEQFWLYSYYCANLLEAFHRAYSQPSKENEYKEIKKRIKDYLLLGEKAKEVEESFIDSLKNTLVSGFKNLINMPYHVAQIRDQVAFTNVCRLYWTFCRLTLVQGFSVAKDMHLIDKLDALLGTHTDVDKIISNMQAPNGILNYFSIGLFLARLMIDSGLLIKHTFFPTELELGLENSAEVTKMAYLVGPARLDAYRNSYILVQEEDDAEIEFYYIPKIGSAQKLNIHNRKILLADLMAKMQGQNNTRLKTQDIKNIITKQTDHKPEIITALDRFKKELYKRHWNFINDFVWATVNLLCNFNHLFGISGALAGGLTTVFLTFDVGMALYRLHLVKQEYLTKKAQYLEEMEEYNNPKRFKSLSSKDKLLHLDLLNKQLMALEINYKTKEALFYFVTAGAILLATGFAASLILASPALIIGAYLISSVGITLYLSSGVYTKYKEKELYLEQAELTGSQNLLALRKEFETARNDFIFALAKNSIIPMVLITTYALCWPAAVALTAVYLGYEVVHAYQQHADKKEAKQLAQPSEPVEEYTLCLPGKY